MTQEDQPKKKKVRVFTDGSSHSKGGLPYGWAFILLVENFPEACNFGGGPEGSNNIAELTAAIKGMEAVERWLATANLLAEDCDIKLVADSQYVLGLACGDFHPKANIDLAKRLRALMVALKAGTKWVRGHNGNYFNELADKLAKMGKEEGEEERDVRLQSREASKK